MKRNLPDACHHERQDSLPPDLNPLGHADTSRLVEDQPGLSVQSTENDPIDQLPAMIRLAVYSVLGGMAGHPVALCFRDYPNDVVASIFGTLSSAVDSARTIEITGRSDVNKFLKNIHDVRLALVYPISRRYNHHAIVDWAIENRRRLGKPLPSVLSLYDDRIPDLPGATLICRGEPNELAAVVEWLHASHSTINYDILKSRDVQADAVPVTFRSMGDRLKTEIRAVGPANNPLRKRRILEGLLAGAAIARLADVNNELAQVEVVDDDYAHVYQLIGAVAASLPDDPYDRLATAMVCRANAYMAMTAVSRPKDRLGMVGRGTNKSRAGKSTVKLQPVPITLKEITDLGDPDCRLVLQLVEFLRRRISFADFQWLGLQRSFADNAQWPNSNFKQLAGLLLPWSYKQAHARFDKLRRQGIIAGRRKSGNAPWEYELPAALMSPSSFVHGLPRPDSDTTPFHLRE